MGTALPYIGVDGGGVFQTFVEALQAQLKIYNREGAAQAEPSTVGTNIGPEGLVTCFRTVH